MKAFLLCCNPVILSNQNVLYFEERVCFLELLTFINSQMECKTCCYLDKQRVGGEGGEGVL